MKKMRRVLSAVLSALLMLSCSGCGRTDGQSVQNTPVTVEIWHYYNGEQQSMFDTLLDEFNKTVGKEKGIIVNGSAQGSVADLERKMLANIHGEVGAGDIPNIFAAYSATAYTADLQGMVVDVSEFLSQSEREAYVDGYIAEGDFAGNGEMKLFPVAKSTEVLVLNETDWNKFAQETGASKDALATIEGLTATAEQYYKWSDGKTPDIPDDGKAFFGRDSMANYILIGGMQLGAEIFGVEDGKLKLNFDMDVVRQLWDYYYIPYIKGYFATSGHFRSDDLKTGTIVSYVGSSAGAPYIPKEVIASDTESYPITVDVLPAPRFEKGEPYAVQQGASMVVTNASEEEVQACVEFLKWFTNKEQNVKFSLQSGYLPVKKESNTHEAVFSSGLEVSQLVENSLAVAIDTVNSSYMHTAKAFDTGIEAREELESILRDRAVKDRETVRSRLASGMSLDEAVQEFCSDVYFQDWYENAKVRLECFESN